MVAMRKWRLNIPEAIDDDVRAMLAEQGESDLDEFVLRAVRRELLRRSVNDARQRFDDLTSDEVQALVDEAVERTRADGD